MIGKQALIDMEQMNSAHFYTYYATIIRRHVSSRLKFSILQLIKAIGIFFLISHCQYTDAVYRTNIMQPYNILVWPQRLQEARISVDFLYQGIITSRGFAALDYSRECSLDLKTTSSKGNVLQLFQPEQDSLAALKGLNQNSHQVVQSYLFFQDFADGLNGLYRPSGNLRVPVNLPMSIHFRLIPHLFFDAYFSFVSMSLDNVCWQDLSTGALFESHTLPDQLQKLASAYEWGLTGWTKNGFGDGSLQVRWQYDFPQSHYFLKNVQLSIRAGAVIPTGTHTNPYQLMSLPIGYDLGWGTLGAGFISLEFLDYWYFKLDLEFLQFFGNTRMRRVATDKAQTDFMLPKITKVLVDPGLTQQYTFIGMKRFADNGLILSAAYQYYKHNDDTYYPCNNSFDQVIMNEVQSTQEWTTHQLVFQARYTFNADNPDAFCPEIGLMGVYGFNGKRAIITSSIGATVSFAY